MSTFDNSKYPIVYIPVKNLSVVWVQAQRPYDKKWAKEIADNLDPDKFDPLVVTKPNGEGIYHIIEGQHRRSGLEMYAEKCNPSGYGGNELAPCRVVGEANPARAAEIWLGTNAARKAVTAVAKFKIGVVAERELESAINKIVRNAGYRVAVEHTDGCISAVNALEMVFMRHSPATLAAVLDTVKQMWGLNPQAVSSALLRGFGMFLHEFGSHIDKKKLQKVADKYNPWKLTEAAKARKESTLEKLDEAISELLIREYNKGLKDLSKKLRHKA